jgi:translation initiation factor IF-2
MKEKTPKNQITRPPIVVVLGHIDHGKTSLLLAIRKMKVPSEKPGGAITQHIGAYQVEEEGKKIAFIDTPGHEAFSAMRSRGAKVADVAILVIDAVDGVKAQTKEAISHIKKTKIPFIIALNKIDKPEADPNKVKRELQKEEVKVEELGGEIPSVAVSAKTGQGIPDLLDLILLVAEMQELKTSLSLPAEGVIIEAYLDSKRGPIATLLLQNGILKTGDIVATSSTLGKIKKLEDFQGKEISRVEPAQPAVLLGLEKVPKVGEKIKFFDNLEKAKEYQKVKEEKVAFPTLEIPPEKKVLNLILKTDVKGSIEAIEEALRNLPQDKVFLHILRAEVGDINENDFKLAKEAKAAILGFRVKMTATAQVLSQREKIKIIRADIIYDLVEAVRKLMEKTIEAKVVREDLGKVKVLLIFLTEKNRQIVGGKVTEGQVEKGTKIEVLRDEELVGKGKLINLQRDKKDVPKLSKGQECGILYEGNVKIEEGDKLVIYRELRKKEEL